MDDAPIIKLTNRNDRKVLFITATLINGGAQRQLTLLIQNLPSTWQKSVISFVGGPFEEVIRAQGISLKVNRRKSRYDVRFFYSIWRDIVRIKPDIVHTWGRLSTSVAFPCCKLLGIPIIDSSIRIGATPKNYYRFSQLLLRMVDRVIANSNAGLEAWGMNSRKGRVIYNAFESARLSRNDLNVSRNDSKCTVVMVARMVPEKDYDTFFKAARELVNEAEQWNFLAIGDGPLRQKFLNDHSDLTDIGILSFPEPELEIIKYIAQADVGVLMTNPHLHSEGCSNAIMEYMACGLPVVCSSSGGNRELVLDGRTGFITSPQNVDALLEKLSWLRDHQNESKTLGTHGRERIMSEFTIEKMVARTMAIYEELIL